MTGPELDKLLSDLLVKAKAAIEDSKRDWSVPRSINVTAAHVIGMQPLKVAPFVAIDPTEMITLIDEVRTLKIQVELHEDGAKEIVKAVIEFFSNEAFTGMCEVEAGLTQLKGLLVRIDASASGPGSALDYAYRMDALAEERNIEIQRLKAEIDRLQKAAENKQ